MKQKIMKNRLLLIFYWTFLFVPNCLAETYQTNHFIIQTDIEPQYVEFIKVNLDAYYENIIGNYFDKGWDKPLLIYYSQKQSDTQQLLLEHGKQGKIKYDGDKIGYGIYIHELPAIYTHREMNDGSFSGWGTLFHETTHHFVALNCNNPPSWFNEGLACILAEQSRIIKGKLLIGKPNPWREYALREMLEKGKQINVKYLMSLSSGQFYSDKNNYHFIRAFFYWLYETGQLKPYIQNVRRLGYTPSALETTTGKSCDVINNELLEFIKKNCYAGAYLQQARITRDVNEKMSLFLKSLELKPDYGAAWLEIARCHMDMADIVKCRDDLQHIINGPVSAEYPEAFLLMGHSFYKVGDYRKAAEYYRQVVDYAAYNEYICEVYYWLANCYDYLKNYKLALQMHAKFLETNWESNRLNKLVDFSKKYVESNQKYMLYKD
jgi:tetratricopeptide (TPR) repeat protein